jgi:hypothetical protein
MRYAIALLSIILAGCSTYAGPMFGSSEIRQGAFPERVSRFLRDAGGARPTTALLPPGARDSGAIYLLVADRRGVGIDAAQVAVLLRDRDTPKPPADGWQPVDGFGVLTAQLSPGEYVVYVRTSRHWLARHQIQVRAGAIDTLLAVMRNGADGRGFYQF